MNRRAASIFEVNRLIRHVSQWVWTCIGWPGFVAAVGFAVMITGLDPAGDYPQLRQGPGLTVDESFNVQEGVRLAVGCKYWISGHVSWRELFGEREDLAHAPIGYHLPDHPPLGRLLLGVGHQITVWVAPPKENDSPFCVAAARSASVFALALTSYLVGMTALRWYGPVAGFAAAIGLLLMPRVFGHGNLAALETFIGLAYSATVLLVASKWKGPGQPSLRVAALCGFVFGLALLTKIQAVFLPIPIAIWALYRWQHRAVWPLTLFGATGLAVFFVGWPWLWLNPVDHFHEYFASATERTVLHTFYLGKRYHDTAVPWHYPWLMVVLTMPVGLLILGLWGAIYPKGRRESGEILLALSIITPLIAFSWPGVSVYDGVRLFLVILPLWAVWIGRGAQLVWESIAQCWNGRVATVSLILLCGAQGIGVWRAAPVYLSYYNALVVWTGGAHTWGLEQNYWGDAVTRDLLQETVRHVPRDSTIHVAPVLHPFQLKTLQEQSPILRNHRVKLRPYDSEKTEGVEYVLVFYRRADFPDLPANTEPIAKTRWQGEVIATVWRVNKHRVKPRP